MEGASRVARRRWGALLLLIGLYYLSAFTRRVHSLKKVRDKSRSAVDEVIREMFPSTMSPSSSFHVDSYHVPPDYTIVDQNVCGSVAHTRYNLSTICCSPTDTRHIYNVLIEDRKLIFFVKKGSSKPVAVLPPVMSTKRQSHINFNLPIEYREGPLEPDRHCKRYFNGTLHVPGRSTVHNIYHACKL